MARDRLNDRINRLVRRHKRAVNRGDSRDARAIMDDIRALLALLG